MPETWTVAGTPVQQDLISYAPGTTATVSGRTRVSIWKKLNPIWWFGNQDEPNPPAWYLPTRPSFWRYLCWYCRNPLVNFSDYVIGAVDCNYTVTGDSPVCCNIRGDLLPPQTGWHRTTLWLYGWLPLPYVSYQGTKVVFYAGWQPCGFFGFKFNLV